MKYFLALATIFCFLIPVSSASAQSQAMSVAQSAYAAKKHPATADRMHDARARHKDSCRNHKKAYRHGRNKHAHHGCEMKKSHKHNSGWKSRKGHYH